jgi:large subunit ribosomal protein L22
MEAYARARFVRTSPRKARIVIDLIRGKGTKQALAILKFTPNFAARLIEKALLSAIANAENNHHMDADNLKVSKAIVDGGPMMKRLRYAPMGRGFRIAKRLSHITIAVEETEPRPEKRPRRKEVARTARLPRFGRKPAAEPAPAKAQPKPKAKAKPKAEAKPKAKAEAKAKPKAEQQPVEAPKKRAPRKRKPEGETDAKGGK